MEPQRSSTHVGRRAVARGAAWSVPVLAAAAAAPAYAASACPGGTARSVTWENNSATSGGNTTQAGTLTGNTVTVSSSYAGSAGSRATRNMASYSINTTRDSFELSNNIPPSGTANIEGNYQTATFQFTSRVSSLTFAIDDIDQTTGSTAFSDRVAIIPELGATASGVKGSWLVGDGTLGSETTTAGPWRTTGGATGYDSRQTVTVTISGGFTSFALRYWTTVGAPSNAQMWIRIRNMQVQSCV